MSGVSIGWVRRIVSSFALVLALLALLASGAPARAARPASGAWTGTVARSTATVSFRVNRSRTHILRLVARVFPVFCYQPRRSKFIARGRFTSSGRLTGYLEEQAAGCVGGLP